jgi:hypothetical protein
MSARLTRLDSLNPSRIDLVERIRAFDCPEIT